MVYKIADFNEVKNSQTHFLPDVGKRLLLVPFQRSVDMRDDGVSASVECSFTQPFCQISLARDVEPVCAGRAQNAQKSYCDNAELHDRARFSLALLFDDEQRTVGHSSNHVAGEEQLSQAHILGNRDETVSHKNSSGDQKLFICVELEHLFEILRLHEVHDLATVHH